MDEGDTGLGCQADSPHPPNTCYVASCKDPMHRAEFCVFISKIVLIRLLEGLVSLPWSNVDGLFFMVVAAAQWAPAQEIVAIKIMPLQSEKILFSPKDQICFCLWHRENYRISCIWLSRLGSRNESPGEAVSKKAKGRDPGVTSLDLNLPISTPWLRHLVLPSFSKPQFCYL